MINCNENENDNERTDHINKTYIDQDVDRCENAKYVISNT